MPLTFGKLKAAIAQLEKIDVSDETLVVMAKRSESGDASPLDEVDLGVYEAENDWSGELTGDDGKPLGPGEVQVIALWPVN
jgi:hypothetical protein